MKASSIWPGAWVAGQGRAKKKEEESRDYDMMMTTCLEKQLTTKCLVPFGAAACIELLPGIELVPEHAIWRHHIL
jgi:hypothetical protein